MVIRYFMVGLLAITLLGGLERADAQSPTQNYLSTRDRYLSAGIVWFRADETYYRAIMRKDGFAAAEEFHKQAGIAERLKEDRELADLQAQLSEIIGQPKICGFGPHGTINLKTLSPYIEIGNLDGLIFRSDSDDARALITTQLLLGNWLNTSDSTVPRAIPTALKSEAFFSFAIGNDMRTYEFGEVPINPPTGAAMSFATLVAETSFETLDPPDKIYVSVLLGDRVYLLLKPISEKLSPPQACEAIAKQIHENWNKDVDVGQASLAYRRCFAEELKGQSFYPAIVREAQALVNRVLLK